MTDAEIQQVCGNLATRLGLGSIRPRVIGSFSNLAIALDPLRIVARIATGTALLRDTRTFAQREVAIASYLAKRGAPIIPPCSDSPAGPHDVDGWTVTLWQLVEVLPDGPDPSEAGKRLAQCHKLLLDYQEDLPYFGAFDELNALLAHSHVQQVLDAGDRACIWQLAQETRSALTSYSATAQTLHGDSHRKNVIQTATGPLWTDWEDRIFAPIEWDLACLVTNARVTGHDREWAEAALSAYGDHDRTALGLSIRARALYGIAWLALLSIQNPDRLARMNIWIKWLRKLGRG